MEWLTKKRLFVITLTWTIALGLFIFIARSNICYRDLLCWSFVEVAGKLGIILFLPTLLLFFSLIIYPLQNVVFDRWKKFAVWAVPAVIAVSIFIITAEGSGGSGVGVYTIDERPFILALLYGWFFIHSIVLIIATAVRERRK